MEGAKKKQFDDTLNIKIQRKFDLIFGSTNPSAKSKTAVLDDEFSSLEYGSEGESMSESAKKEKNAPSVNLELGNDEMDFHSDSNSSSPEVKKESTGKLSIVPDDDDGLEFNLDFGDDSADIPAVPMASAASAGNAKAETKSDSHFELDLNAGTEEDTVIENRPASAASAPAPDPSADTGGFDLGNSDDFDAEIEMAASKVSLKESTQPTIVIDKNTLSGQTTVLNELNDDLNADFNADFNADEEFSAETTGSTNSSSDLMTTEESKANIESTIKDILRPKFNQDSTQEFDLGDLSENNSESIPSMEFNAEELGSDQFAVEAKASAKKEGTADFDLSGMEFADKEETELPTQKSAQAPVQAPAETRMDRSQSSFVSDEESTRFHATIRQLREERDSLLNEIKMLKGQTRELEQDNLTLKAALDESKIENSIIRKRHLNEMEDFKYRASVAEEKRAFAEERAKNAEAKKEKLEQRVRIDFNQVKQREKELETKLEMLSIDVDSQVHSRDQKILELRRKIDALEFNMENVSIREQKSQDDKRKLEDKLNKIMKTLRHSIKNLEDDIDQVAEDSENDNDDSKLKSGAGQGKR